MGKQYIAKLRINDGMSTFEHQVTVPKSGQFGLVYRGTNGLIFADTYKYIGDDLMFFSESSGGFIEVKDGVDGWCPEDGLERIIAVIADDEDYK